jgi:hypothetical protein
MFASSHVTEAIISSAHVHIVTNRHELHHAVFSVVSWARHVIAGRCRHDCVCQVRAHIIDRQYKNNNLTD